VKKFESTHHKNTHSSVHKNTKEECRKQHISLSLPLSLSVSVCLDTWDIWYTVSKAPQDKFLVVISCLILFRNDNTEFSGPQYFPWRYEKDFIIVSAILNVARLL
jgi:hypothetical protein